jgi:hypothetical protein
VGEEDKVIVHYWCVTGTRHPICASGVRFLCYEPPAAGHNPGFLDEELPDRGVLRY